MTESPRLWCLAQNGAEGMRAAGFWIPNFYPMTLFWALLALVGVAAHDVVVETPYGPVAF